MSFIRSLRDELAERWPLGVGVLVFAVALWAQAHAMVGVFFDDGIYVQLARSLAEGTGYRSVHLPDAPAAVHYPPLYPFALSVLWRLWPAFPANVTLFELFDSAALGLAAGLTATHARRAGFSAVLGGLALLAAFGAFPLLTLIGVRFSEPLFLVLAAAALLVVNREGLDLRHALLGGALAGAAVLTRSIGIAVVGGIVVGLWVRGHRSRAATAAAVAGALVIPWGLYLIAHGDAIDPLLVSNYGTYGQFAGQAGLGSAAAGINLGAFAPLVRLLLPSVTSTVLWPLTVLLATVVGVGAWTMFGRAPSLVCSVGFYLVIVTLWPYVPDRFVWIALPWISLLLVAGMEFLWRRGAPARWAVLVLVAAVGVGFVPRQVRSLASRGFAQTAIASSERFAVLANGIASGLPDSAVVATDAEALIYIYTNRRTVPVYFFEMRGREAVQVGTDQTVAYWCRQGVTHVAMSSPAPEIIPLLQDLEERTDVAVRLLFSVRDGPRLMEFGCVN